MKLSLDRQVCVTCFGFWEFVLAHHIDVKVVLIDGWGAHGTENELISVAMRPNVVEPTERPLLVARKKLMGVRCSLIKQVILSAMEHLELSDKIRFCLFQTFGLFVLERKFLRELLVVLL